VTLSVYTSKSFVDCNHFQIGCFVVAGFVLTSALRGASAIAELLVKHYIGANSVLCAAQSALG